MEAVTPPTPPAPGPAGTPASPVPASRIPLVRLTALVFVGGAVGTSARALLEQAFAPEAPAWPWVTFAINLAGSFVLGVLLHVLARAGQDTGWRRDVRVGCGTGILGGFTTYSTFVLEVDRLLRDGQAAVGLLYAVVSVVAGIALAVLGVRAATQVRRPRRVGPGDRDDRDDRDDRGDRVGRVTA
ncbi:hypothetical protein CBZ_24830 [Cellulomonas biazotea]|uniref:Fluoride-specific ion channel FluC n=1 Tax=Cellulomonas biazotea TaxID=1709 RepID=A0A402DTI0_9CELL|nr:hypothetical protein CBZ_24830 [Cellulomonas biazotea]